MTIFSKERKILGNVVVKKYRIFNHTFLRKEKSYAKYKIKLFDVNVFMKTKNKNKYKYFILGLKIYQKNIKSINSIKYYNSNKIINFKYENHPLVSIIIPVYNQIAYTKNCLNSILLNTKNVSYEIIIADDNSSDNTKYISDCVKNITIIRNGYNIGFLKNCNKASKVARGKYILFLNNDTIVRNDWLRPLVETFEKDDSIGLVGSKLIFEDGSLQEAGGVIFKDASGCNYGRNDDPDKLEYNYVKDVDYISGASIMIPKKIWNKLGGFDEQFAPAYYEDTDLAFQIRYNFGLRVVYQPKSTVIHLEGKSNGTDINAGIKKYQEINKHKFYNKWKSYLNKYHATDSSQIFLARDHAVNKKNILVIDWKILSFTKDTGSRATYQYMHFFKRHGFNVKLFPHSFFIEDDFLEKHLQDGFEVIHDNFQQWIQNNGKFIDVVYLNRPNIAPYYIDNIRKYTHSKVIFQGHDLHYLRRYRENCINKKENAYDIMCIEKRNELNTCSKMDICCYFSYKEIEILKKEAQYLKTKVIPLFIFDTNKMDKKVYNAHDRFNIAFVAGFSHSPNIDGAVWFCKNIFPKIQKSIKNIKLYLVGSNPTDEIFSLKSDNIIITGFVTDEQLESIYKSIRLTVVPLRYGAGVKGKIIESIYNKVPVITTSIGIEGINNDDNIVSIANSEDEFANIVINQYCNFELLNKISEKSKDYINKYFSDDAAYRIFSNILDEPL